MRFYSMFDYLKPAHSRSRSGQTRRGGHRQRPAPRKLQLEALEDRCLLSFSPAVSYPVGTNPQAVVTADFNRDGKLDLAVANYNDSSVSVLLGNGDGTFQPGLTSAPGGAPLSLAVGDFDGDGKLDLATANRGGWDVSALLGNGDGTFNQSAYILLGSYTYSRSVAVGDFNGDGRLDLGVSAIYSDFDSYGQVNVLLGNGHGSFSEPNVTWLGNAGNQIAAVAADLNGDGFDDFVTLAPDYDAVRVLLGDSTGYLQSSPSLRVGSVPYSVAARDLNGDGHTDLVTANDYGSSVSVLLGNGAGGFSAAANFATGRNPFAVVLGDFTGDGKVDVATADWSFNLSVLPGGGDGTFAAAVNSAGGSYPTGVAAGDFNGDGWLDRSEERRVGKECRL